MQEFRCAIEYKPGGRYTRRALIEEIEKHRELLCFFVKQAGEKQCALGVDFEKYARKGKLVPIHIIPDWAVQQVLIPAEGQAFQKAYRRSRVGEHILVTFTARQAVGWFELEWELDEEQILTDQDL